MPSGRPLMDNIGWACCAYAHMGAEGPVVGMSSITLPHEDRDDAGSGSVATRTVTMVLQNRDDAADGVMAVSPADKVAQIVGGGLNHARHDATLRWSQKDGRVTDAYNRS